MSSFLKYFANTLYLLALLLFINGFASIFYQEVDQKKVGKRIIV